MPKLSLATLARLRLHAQHLADGGAREPRQAVAGLLAVQAQDYLASLWAVGRRTRGATEADVEAALEKGTIVRTWPMRGTLHLVAAEDVRWLLALCAPRALARAAGRHRQLGLERQSFERARAALDLELAGGGRLTRAEAYRVLAQAGVSPAGQRGIHLLWGLAHEGYLCLGPRAGKQFSVVRLDDWVAPGRQPSRQEALRELARRYVAGHGPASDADLAWWAGLSLGEARAALGSAALGSADGATGRLWRAADRDRARASRTACLLPVFDELLVGFADREALVAKEHRAHVLRGGLLAATLVVDGRAVGTWRRTLARGRVRVELSAFAPITTAARAALEREVERYGRFLGLEPEARWRR